MYTSKQKWNVAFEEVNLSSKWPNSSLIIPSRMTKTQILNGNYIVSCGVWFTWMVCCVKLQWLLWFVTFARFYVFFMYIYFFLFQSLNLLFASHLFEKGILCWVIMRTVSSRAVWPFGIQCSSAWFLLLSVALYFLQLFAGSAGVLPITS